jgi:carboxylesterase type B
VPFAAPPIGPLRWKPPVAPSSWKTTLSTKDYRKDCLQWHAVDFLAGKTSEDCLFLNVWSPLNVTTPLPVMLFFYGGSWSWGGTQFVLYDAVRVLKKRQDVIIVTSNYRLGALGFMASTALQSERESKAVGNYGLLDQRFAMQWIQNNIAAFGGAKLTTTIWGESAGAGSVSNHLVMKRSWPYFQQAIIESGPAASWVARPLSVFQAVYTKYVSTFGCGQGTASQQLACLRSVDAVSIMNNVTATPIEQASTNVTSFWFVPWGPVIDGVELLDHPQRLVRKGQLKQCPTLLGTNRFVAERDDHLLA